MDKGPMAGDHLWAVSDAVLQSSGYEKRPEWSEVSSTAVTSGHLPYGAFCWRGGQTGRIYAATNNKFWEIADSSATDVTGSTVPTNATNGVSFAAYGEWAFAANGVDKIQAIKVPSTIGSSLNFSDMNYTTGGAKIIPKYICSHKNHVVAANIKFAESWRQISTFTTAAGSAFTNQPTNSGVKFVCTGAEAGSMLIIGTVNGTGDTVRAEVLPLTGVGTTTSAFTNWNKILGISYSTTAANNISTQRTSDSGVIVAWVAGDAAKGVSNVTAGSQTAGGRVIDIVASGATTKQVGLIGTSYAGSSQYDSQALTGTTIVQSNSEFDSVQNVLIGDIENTVTITITSYVYPAGYEDPYLAWWSGTDDPEGYGNEANAPQIVGSSDQPLLDGQGKITGVVDGGDCFFVFKEGSVHRFDGPPFQPTVVSWNTGMLSGNRPYKQGDRIYFWSDNGLSYIDVNTNKLENVLKGIAQRSIIDYANANFGSVQGGYPKSRTANIEYSNAVNTGTQVSISGDPVNSLVLVLYNNASAPGANMLVYHEVEDAFTLFTGPDQTVNAGGYLVNYVSGIGEAPGLLQRVRAIHKKDATHFSLTKMAFAGFSNSVTHDVYFRWPFVVRSESGMTSKVIRVKPVFNNSAVSTSSVVYDITVEVISMSGQRKSWVVNGILSTGKLTSSLSGWITVDNCPFSDAHSVGISIKGSGVSAPFNPGLINFVGCEVEYQESPVKSL